MWAVVVVVAVVVATCVGGVCGGGVRVCVLCVRLPSPIDRAREIARDRATHINECARATARWAVVAVAAACVVAACVYVCVYVCVFMYYCVLHPSSIEPVKQSAIARRIAPIAPDQRRGRWWRRRSRRWWLRVCACVCYLLCTSLIDRAREATRDRVTHICDFARGAARWVAVVLVVAACVAVVVVACVVVACVCSFVVHSLVCCFTPRSEIEPVKQRAITRRTTTIAPY